MPNKIPPEVKCTESFRYAQSQFDVNNREAARYSSFFVSDDDWYNASTNVKNVLVYASMEPNVDSQQLAYSIERDGMQHPTRSKLVMEYNRHKRMLDNIRKLRQANQKLCDSILDSIPADQVAQAQNKRALILDVLNHRINP